MKVFWILLFYLLVDVAQAEKFDFDNDLQEWGSWGTGIGAHNELIGHSKSGSMWLSADWGEVQTLHYRWSKLKAGLYRVTAYVRARNVQKHQEGSSFWHFYDTGSGTENVFLSLDGSYDWRKIQYTVRVNEGLSVWFRLKSPGQVWIDDFTLEAVDSSQKLYIEPPVALKEATRPNKRTVVSSKESILLDFENKNSNHPFIVSNLMGKFSSREYYNLSPSHFQKGNWSEYDRIGLDVFNGSGKLTEFYLTLGDHQSRNYWTQLNHKTHLAPGWNHLTFDLRQYVGERGSHRFLRSLNLKSLQKFFIVVDPNERHPKSSQFYIDNVKLSRHPHPEVPAGVWAFDFTSHKDFSDTPFKKVTSQTLFEEKNGFGFIEPEYWRIEDSQWTPLALRYSIGLLNGHFRVKLPNGTYKVQLVLDRLGYWDPSFWKNRTIFVNGEVVYKESRNSGMDYIKDLLQFEAIVPSADDHPFDLYLKRIFRSIEVTARVTNGYLDLRFEGDPTAISLNTAIIWNVNNAKNAQVFLEALNDHYRKEFDWMTRPIQIKAHKDTLPLARLIAPSLELSPQGTYASVGNSINFWGVKKERPYQLLQLRGKGKASIHISDLIHHSGQIVSGKSFFVGELVPQYVSPDLNHETYMLAGKYIRPLTGQEISLSEKESTFIWLQLPLDERFKRGDYTGKLTVKNDKQEISFPIKLRFHDSDLPEVEFPVGFFGPDPIAQTYFESSDLEKIRKNYRHKAISLLGNAGFTTMSGLPGVKIIAEDDFWRMDSTAPDETMTAAIKAGMKPTFFSYGGKFPQQIFDGSLIPRGMKEDEFFQKSSELLSIYLTQKGMPRIVHTFSDEAGGYSDKIQEDLTLAKKIKTFFPFLPLGGFGSPSDEKAKELNQFFEYGFYSNVSKSIARSLKEWGSYNASPGNLDDPRYTLGPGLFYARSLGLSHYLEWHASSVNNYPYYDLDGRESDVTMFMPSSNGELYPTLRFELATQGLNCYRKLKLLESLLKKDSRNKASLSANVWLDAFYKGRFADESNILKPAQAFNFSKFATELNQHLDQLLFNQ